MQSSVRLVLCTRALAGHTQLLHVRPNKQHAPTDSCPSDLPSPPPLVLDTGAAASLTVAVTTPLAAAGVTPAMGAAARVGGFMQVPVLEPLAMMQVKPWSAQQAAAPLVVQPEAPTALQAVLGQGGCGFLQVNQLYQSPAQTPASNCTMQSAQHHPQRDVGAQLTYMTGTK